MKMNNKISLVFPIEFILHKNSCAIPKQIIMSIYLIKYLILLTELAWEI